MIDTIVGALLPIVMTLLLGMVAGWHHDFDGKQAAILNRMVMLYALPLSLFASMIGTSRLAVIAQWPLALVLLGAMMGGYVVTWGVARLRGCDHGIAALYGLSVGGPAVPFVGVSVLGHLFGDSSAIAIAICGLVMNVIQVPLSLILLGASASSEASGDTPARQPRSDSAAVLVLRALGEPVVWGPLLALVFILLGVRLPDTLRESLALLGRATGGVALFASGIILFSRSVAFSAAIGMAVIARNLVMPLLTWAVVLPLFSPRIGQEAVVTIAIPSASIATILAVQYRKGEQEMASVLFFSTIVSVLTMGGFIWLTAP